MSGPVPPRRRNWWPWLPAIVFAAIIPANLAIILVARQMRSGHAEDRPYLASLHADEDLAAQRAWSAGGWALAQEPIADGVRLRLAGPATGAARVLRYRPSDPALDADLPWPEPAQPLDVPLPAPGAWELTVLAGGPAGPVRQRFAIDRPRPPERP